MMSRIILSIRRLNLLTLYLNLAEQSCLFRWWCSFVILNSDLRYTVIHGLVRVILGCFIFFTAILNYVRTTFTK